MIKVYIGELLPEVRPFPILNKHLGKEKYTGKKAYRAIFDEMDFSFIELIDNPEEADFFLLPYNYLSIKDQAYIDSFIAQAEKYKKRIIIFAYGDREDEIKIKNTIIFRCAGYRYQKPRDNEIIMPTQIYAGDILEESLFCVREKREIPTVSFCGWAGFNSVRQRLKYFSKIISLDVKKYIFFNKHTEVHKQGMYWRKKAIKALKKSPRIKISFVIRNFYSANKYTIQGDPKVLRKEYIENMQNSDFVLAPRGDGNYSVRFYEALALGRIPVLVDTDCVLPLEGVVDYKKFVVFVPYTDIKNTDKYIREFWDKLTNEEFHAVQKLARNTFMNYLKFDAFLKYTFEHIKT